VINNVEASYGVVDGILNVPTTADSNLMSKKESVHHIANLI